MLARPGGRIVAGVVATVALVAIAAVVVYGVYVYGGARASTAGASATGAPTLKPTQGETVYTIDSSSSEATFTMHEVLFGDPKSVTGKTNQVSGQILINTSDPAKSRLGPIRVDVSTLLTDNDMRNNTIQGRILETGDAANQFATFSATSFSGLPATITTGQTVTFQVTGNLSIHQVTKVSTFAVTLTMDSASQVSGSATTVVRYADFNLAIPNVPQVTGVSNDVTLKLAFTAKSA